MRRNKNHVPSPTGLGDMSSPVYEQVLPPTQTSIPLKENEAYTVKIFFCTVILVMLLIALESFIHGRALKYDNGICEHSYSVCCVILLFSHVRNSISNFRTIMSTMNDY